MLCKCVPSGGGTQDGNRVKDRDGIRNGLCGGLVGRTVNGSRRNLVLTPTTADPLTLFVATFFFFFFLRSSVSRFPFVANQD